MLIKYMCFDIRKSSCGSIAHIDSRHCVSICNVVVVSIVLLFLLTVAVHANHVLHLLQLHYAYLNQQS